MKNKQSEIKPMEIGKKPGITYGVKTLHIILAHKK